MAWTLGTDVATGDVLTSASWNNTVVAAAGGVVAYASKTADQTGITTVTDITSLSVTFTATSSRYYRTSVYAIGAQVTAVGNEYLYITDGSNVEKAQARWTMAAGYYLTLYVSVVETGLSGSITRKARGQCTVGGSLTINAGATYPAYIVVEDLGEGA